MVVQYRDHFGPVHPEASFRGLPHCANNSVNIYSEYSWRRWGVCMLMKVSVLCSVCVLESFCTLNRWYLCFTRWEDDSREKKKSTALGIAGPLRHKTSCESHKCSVCQDWLYTWKKQDEGLSPSSSNSVLGIYGSISKDSGMTFQIYFFVTEIFSIRFWVQASESSRS